jgi:hypothetical protein
VRYQAALRPDMLLVNFILTDFFVRLDLAQNSGLLTPFFRHREATHSVSVIKNGKNRKEGLERPWLTRYENQKAGDEKPSL